MQAGVERKPGDKAHQELAGLVDDVVQEPTTMPWGNRSLLFRDPDGNLVNFLHAGHSGRYREVRLVVCQTEQRHRKKGA